MGISADQEGNTTAEWTQEIRKLVVPSAVPAKPPSSHRLRLRYGRGDMRFVSAHAVRLLVNAGEAYPEMLAAIDGATDHVELETYTLRDDGAGQTFQQALVRASS